MSKDKGLRILANAYSEDLRLRAVDLIDSGKTVLQVEKILKIGKSTLYLWLKRRKETGSIIAKSGWRKGHGPSITDLEAFKKFVQDNQELTSKQMAEKLGGMTGKTVLKWLHKIGFTRKKRVTATVSGTKKNVSYIWSN